MRAAHQMERMHADAARTPELSPSSRPMLTYADVCWRMLTYADVCSWSGCTLTRRTPELSPSSRLSKRSQARHFFLFFFFFPSVRTPAHASACSRRSKRLQARVCVLIQRLCVSAYYVCMYVCVRILDYVRRVHMDASCLILGMYVSAYTSKS